MVTESAASSVTSTNASATTFAKDTLENLTVPATTEMHDAPIAVIFVILIDSKTERPAPRTKIEYETVVPVNPKREAVKLWH